MTPSEPEDAGPDRSTVGKRRPASDRTAAKRGWRRPRISSMGPLREAAKRFCPPYEVEADAPWDLRIKLRDPTGGRPNITLRHRHDRRLFLKANYTVMASTVPGEGPVSDGELTVKFRGPLKRQRASLAWKDPVPDGEEWLVRLRRPLLDALGEIEAVQSCQIRWSAARGSWRVSIETMSGSMVSGIMTPLPIAVPFDEAEATAVIRIIDALGSRA